MIKNQNSETVIEHLDKMSACSGAMEWVAGRDLFSAIMDCTNPEWLLWALRHRLIREYFDIPDNWADFIILAQLNWGNGRNHAEAALEEALAPLLEEHWKARAPVDGVHNAQITEMTKRHHEAKTRWTSAYMAERLPLDKAWDAARLPIDAILIEAREPLDVLYSQQLTLIDAAFALQIKAILLGVKIVIDYNLTSQPSVSSTLLEVTGDDIPF